MRLGLGLDIHSHVGIGDGGGSLGNSLLDCLIWYYELEEDSGSRSDAGPNGLNLAEVGSVSKEFGVIGDAADFDGGTEKLINSFDPIYDLSDTDFSITGWMYLEANVSAHAVYIGNGGTSNVNRVINLIYLSGGNEMRFVLSNDSSTTNLLAGQISGSIPIAEWFFFCMRYNKTTKEMSLLLNDETPVTLTAAGNPHNLGDQSFVVGNSVSDQNPLEGRVDEVGGWDRLITDAECAFLFKGGSNTLMQDAIWYYRLEEASGTRMDASNSDLDLSETGTVGQLAGVIEEAASFPGSTGNFLSHAFDSIYDIRTKDITVTGWVRFDTLTANQEIVYVGTANRIASAMVFDIRLFAGSDNIQASVSDGTDVEMINLGVVVADVFNFFCMRYNFTTKLLEGRLNGNAFVTLTTSLGTTNNPGTQSFVIGQHGTANNLDGRIDEVGGFDKILSDAEVDTLYNNGLGQRPEFGAGRPNFQQFVENADGTRLENADGDFIIT